MFTDHFKQLPGALILTLHGSRLFGVHNPSSDLDVKALTKPPLKALLLGHKDTLTPREKKLDDLEFTTHPVQSFINMLKRGDTNAIDMPRHEPHRRQKSPPRPQPTR